MSWNCTQRSTATQCDRQTERPFGLLKLDKVGSWYSLPRSRFSFHQDDERHVWGRRQVARSSCYKVSCAKVNVVLTCQTLICFGAVSQSDPVAWRFIGSRRDESFDGGGGPPLATVPQQSHLITTIIG